MARFALMLIATHGPRQDVLRALRRLTGRALGELATLMEQLPHALCDGTEDALTQLAANASAVLDLQVWYEGRPVRRALPRQVGPHVERRVTVPVAPDGVRFRVDDVDAATAMLPTRLELDSWATLCDGAPVCQAAH